MIEQRQYMYVFVRTDLSVPQQIIQSSHASACIGEKYHSDTNIVLFGTENEESLKKMMKYMERHDIDYHPFYEPDISSFTSIASEPISGSKRNCFKNFKLLK